jgi:hypothetical protein
MRVLAGPDRRVAWCVRGKATASSLCGVQVHEEGTAVAVNASITETGQSGMPDGPAEVPAVEDAPFSVVPLCQAGGSDDRLGAFG